MTSLLMRGNGQRGKITYTCPAWSSVVRSRISPPAGSFVTFHDHVSSGNSFTSRPTSRAGGAGGFLAPVFPPARPPGPAGGALPPHRARRSRGGGNLLLQLGGRRG